MIRRITIATQTIISLLLPPYKRQLIRLAWLQGLLYPYYEVEQTFYTWRDAMIVRAKVTGQTASLQWYLNYLYDSTLWRILIVDSVAGGIAVSLESEGTAYVVAGLEGTVGEDGVAFYLEGESSSSIPYDFRVLTPNTVDVIQLQATVDLYNMAHRSYDVVTF
jgi:hypothetical protein